MGDQDQLHDGGFPQVRYEVFFFSLGVAIILMLLLSLPGSRGRMIGSSGGIVDLATWIADPILVHGVGVLIVASLLNPIAQRFTKGKRLWAWGLSILSLGLLLFVVYGFNELILKPSFNYARPDPDFRLPAPWLSGMLGLDLATNHDSCPSGFVVRQMCLLMLGIVLYPGFLMGSRKTKKASLGQLALLIILFVTVLYAAFSRVYRGFHTWYDIGISLSVSCYMFWFFYYLASVFARHVPDEMDVGIAAATCILVPTYLYYSQDAHWWLIIGISVFCVIGMTRVVPRREPFADIESETREDGGSEPSGDDSTWSSEET